MPGAQLAHRNRATKVTAYMCGPYTPETPDERGWPLPQGTEAVAQTLGHWIESQPTIWVTSCKAMSRPLSPLRD